MGLLLVLLFLVVPLVELYVIVQVGQRIGYPWTLGALLVVSVAGAALVKREGRGAWRRFRAALDAGRIPAEEVVDGALLLLGGALLLTPGFLTDAVGLLLVVPVSRRAVNHGLRRRVRAAFGLDSPRSSRRVSSRQGNHPVQVQRVERRDDPRMPQAPPEGGDPRGRAAPQPPDDRGEARSD